MLVKPKNTHVAMSVMLACLECRLKMWMLMLNGSQLVSTQFLGEWNHLGRTSRLILLGLRNFCGEMLFTSTGLAYFGTSLGPVSTCSSTWTVPNLSIIKCLLVTIPNVLNPTKHWANLVLFSEAFHILRFYSARWKQCDGQVLRARMGEPNAIL